MRLLYAFIEDFKNIKNQEFVFTKEYSFERKGTEVTVTKNEGVEDFTFGDNLYINAIVGENGAGKSSLIEFLLCIQNIKNFDSFREYLIIFEEDIIKYSKHNNSKMNILGYNIEVGNFSFEDKHTVYYSNVLTKSKLYSNHFQNISTSYLLDDKGIDSFDYRAFRIKELNKQAVLFSQVNSIFEKSFPMKFPQKIFLRINKEGKTFQEKIDTAIKEIHERTKFIKSEMNIPKDINAQYLNDVLMAYNIIKEKPTGFFNLNDKIELDLIKNFLNLYKEEPVELRENKSKKTKTYVPNCEFIWIDENNIELYLSAGEQVLLELFARHFEIINETLVNYEKGLYKSNIPTLFYIDEPDSSLHPEWQRQFISLLSKFIKYYQKKIWDYNNIGYVINGEIDNESPLKSDKPQTHVIPYKQIQIILTTHSPILLSDIPRDNCIFLKKKDNGNCEVTEITQQTFGANVYDLLKDGFFMDNGFIGEYARNRIEELLKKIEEVKNIKDIKEIKKTIDIIGEPIIRTHLIKLITAREKQLIQKRKPSYEELLKENERLQNELKDATNKSR